MLVDVQKLEHKSQLEVIRARQITLVSLRSRRVSEGPSAKCNKRIKTYSITSAFAKKKCLDLFAPSSFAGPVRAEPCQNRIKKVMNTICTNSVFGMEPPSAGCAAWDTVLFLNWCIFQKCWLRWVQTLFPKVLHTQMHISSSAWRRG